MRKDRFAFVAALLLAAPIYGGFWGAGTVDHGHTGPGDGGALSNPTFSGSITVVSTVNANRGSFIRTSGANNAGTIDWAVISSWTARGTTTGVNASVYALYNTSGTPNAGAGHGIGLLGRAINTDPAWTQALMGTEGRCDSVSTTTAHIARGSTNLAVFDSSISGGSQSFFVGTYSQAQAYNGDGATPRSTGTLIAFYAPGNVGGSTSYSFLGANANDIFYSQGILWAGGSSLHSGAATFSAAVNATLYSTVIATTPAGTTYTFATDITTTTKAWVEVQDAQNQFSNGTFTPTNAGLYKVDFYALVGNAGAGSLDAALITIVKNLVTVQQCGPILTGLTAVGGVFTEGISCSATIPLQASEPLIFQALGSTSSGAGNWSYSDARLSISRILAP